jgi:hypothetical protein
MDAAILSKQLEETHHYELLMEFLLDLIRKDIEQGVRDGAFMYYCGVEDIRVWFPYLNDAFSLLRARVEKRSLRYVPEWISLV